MFRLRPATVKDYVHVANWIPDRDACIRWSGASMQYPFTAADLPRIIADSPSLVAGETRECFALEEARDEAALMVAYGELVRESATTARLARILVAPSARGRRVGVALCRCLIGCALDMPLTETIRLKVYRDNASARRLYERLGFTEVSGAADPAEDVLACGSASAGSSTRASAGDAAVMTMQVTRRSYETPEKTRS